METKFDEIMRAVEGRTATIGVIGLGYVGLPLVREFLLAGFRVLGFDTDRSKVERIERGQSYIEYIDPDMLAGHVKNGRFRPTDDFQEIGAADALLVCVPTPLGKHSEPDLGYVHRTVESIAGGLRKGHLVVLESTTYPGTTAEEVLPILNRSGLTVGEDFFLGYSPEREDPGNREFPRKKVPKIVSGITKHCLLLVKALYSAVFDTVVPVTSTNVAESTKLLENIYRSVNIALVNELKIILGEMDIDIWEVIEAAKTKPFGFQPFYPGPGLGGHCIPIDPFYLTWKAREYDIHTRFIELAGEINTAMPARVLEVATRALGESKKALKGSEVLVLGVSYKKDVGDIRESPSLKLISLLYGAGARVVYHDPHVPVLPRTRKYDFDMRSVPLDPGTLSKKDLVMILTDHSKIDYRMVREHSSLIVDTRNTMKVRGVRDGKIWKA